MIRQGFRPIWRRPAAAALLAVATVAGPAAAFEFPRDPGGTLDRVTATGTIRAGVSDHPPWVTLGDGPPEGVEVDLLKGFAADLGVSVEWHALPALRALDALERGVLDLAIGGFDRASVAAHAGASPSFTYFVDPLLVAARPGAPLPDSLEGLAVFAGPDIFARQALRDRDALPVQDPQDAEYAALPAWRLTAADLVPVGVELYRTDRVFAVPQGENAWLMRLERFLRARQEDIPDALSRLAP